jgi:hypothetical protein
MTEPTPALTRAARIHRISLLGVDGRTLRCEACGRTWNKASHAWGTVAPRWWACPHGCNA